MMAIEGTVKSILLVVAAGMISACATTTSQPYTSTSPDNITLTQELSAGRAELRIYSLDKNCIATYQGTVTLGDQAVHIGIPSGKSSYLRFKFSKYTLATGAYSISQPVYLTPHSGYYYDIKASYVDTMYGVQVSERDKSGQYVRDVISTPPKACKM